MNQTYLNILSFLAGVGALAILISVVLAVRALVRLSRAAKARRRRIEYLRPPLPPPSSSDRRLYAPSALPATFWTRTH